MRTEEALLELFAAHVCTQNENYISKDFSNSFNRRMA